MTKHYQVEPRGFGHSKFGQPVNDIEFGTQGFGDPSTKHTTNNAEGTGGTPTYTPINDD